MVDHNGKSIESCQLQPHTFGEEGLASGERLPEPAEPQVTREPGGGTFGP